MTLAPGDIVTIRKIAAEPTEDTGLVVDEKGNLHVPLAGDVKVAGLSLTEAEKAVEKAVQRFDRVARISLVLQTPTGQMATVVGAVTQPGRVQALPGTRVADLLASAGGPASQTSDGEYTVLADLHRARLVRDGRTVPVSVLKAVEGDRRHNVRVRAGDQLYVPPSTAGRIAVVGELRNGRLLPYRPGIRLTEVLSASGGTTLDGDRGDIRIIRGPSEKPTVYVADLKDIIDGDAPDVQLAPGDVVYVTDHWIADVGEVLNRLSPILTTGLSVGLAIGLANAGL